MNRQIEFKICIRRKLILGEVEGWVFGRSPGWIEASQGFIACVVDAMLGGGDAALGCKAVEDYCVGGLEPFALRSFLLLRDEFRPPDVRWCMVSREPQ